MTSYAWLVWCLTIVLLVFGGHVGCGDETRGDVINNFDCHVEIYTEAQLNAELADGSVEEGDVLAELENPDGTVSYEVNVCNGVQASEDNDSTVANGTINVGVNAGGES